MQLKPIILIRNAATHCPVIRLYCFPHAGGTGKAFLSWANLFSAEVEIVAVQLPHRYAAANVEREASIRALAVELSHAIALRQEADPTPVPFAFYGHSLGALIAFELTHQLISAELSIPFLLSVSGHRAPSCPLRRSPIHVRSDDEVIERLKMLGGLPASLMQNKKAISVLLPTLRADLRLSECYQPMSDRLLALPIVAFRGSADPLVSEGELCAWKAETSRDCQLYTLSGGHFFESQSTEEMIFHIQKALFSVPEVSLTSDE
ncbi:thioesterase II family protein [Undibacterium sp. Dicai25W]|uniref:thioesterase II family protein n=1 Tax=Undibacterium sp. Dicai25W TaxID=3413034 RepID=UPI003BF420C0